MNRHLITIMLLIIHLPVFGQHQLGLKANAGLSKISNSVDPGSLIYNNHFQFSASGGLFYNFQFGNKSILGADLLFSQIEGMEKFSIYINNGNDAISSFDKIYKHISYLNLPIYYGLKVKKFIVNVGFQASLVLASGACEIGETSLNGNITTWDKKDDELNIDNYDFGPRAGIIYNITDKLSIEGTYYYGLNDIADNDGPNWGWKIQQAVVGLRYAFLASKKNEINK